MQKSRPANPIRPSALHKGGDKERKRYFLLIYKKNMEVSYPHIYIDCVFSGIARFFLSAFAYSDIVECTVFSTRTASSSKVSTLKFRFGIKRFSKWPNVTAPQPSGNCLLVGTSTAVMSTSLVSMCCSKTPVTPITFALLNTFKPVSCKSFPAVALFVK